MAQKRTKVEARLARLGERHIVRPIIEFDGKRYYINEAEYIVTAEMVQNGAMMVRNPDGEIYPYRVRESFIKNHGNIHDTDDWAWYEVNPYSVTNVAFEKTYQNVTIDAR